MTTTEQKAAEEEAAVQALSEEVRAALEDVKAVDVSELDVRQQCSFTDRMIFASGTSNRHVKALVDAVVVAAKAGGHEILGVEGTETNEWVLIDMGDVVTHVMQAEPRRFYDLERLWAAFPPDEAEAEPEEETRA